MKWIVIHRNDFLDVLVAKEYDAPSAAEAIIKWGNDVHLTSEHILSITRSN